MLVDSGADVSGMGVRVFDVQPVVTESQAMMRMTRKYLCTNTVTSMCFTIIT